jgi:colanic acid biosynthesis glycosyl transferase WcaI
MRILLLSTYFRPDVASTGIIMSKLADEFVARGHEVTVVTSVPHYDTNQVWPEFSKKLIFTERAQSMRVHRLYTYVAKQKSNVAQRILSYGSFSLLSFLRSVTLKRHDAILVPSPPLSNGVVADFIGRIRGIPYVYNVQDIWPDVAVRAGILKSPKTIARLARMESYVYARAAGISVISEGFRSNLLAKGVPDEKISVIPNFIDTEFIVPTARPNPFSTANGLDNKFVVLFAGNMGFSQGLETVMDAAKILEPIPQIQFLLVGNGAGREDALAHFASVRPGNVKFLPFQPVESLPSMYGSADVCLIPLRRGFTSESVPCKMYTIMAAGKPSIASVDPGSDTSILLTRTGAGVCVTPEDPQAMATAVLNYYRDSQSREEAGRKARLCAETDFLPGSIAERYIEALQSAIDRGSRLRGRGFAKHHS